MVLETLRTNHELFKGNEKTPPELFYFTFTKS